MNAEIIIRQLKMPLTIRAFTMQDENGIFNIYLNEGLSDEAKRRSLEHEKKHIRQGDFISSKCARDIESNM